MADYLNIAGRIRTTASDGVAMEAQEVKDLNLNKSQQEINADVQTELGDRYTKEETYSKEQLDDLITTPDVNHVSVVATDATTAVTDILPATGEANTIYRVGNWNGTQYDSTMYALYAWNGSAYVCIAVRSFVGEVYDISVNHPDGQGNPTPYADLAAALGTNGANIPADIRRGGMEIKFIQGTVHTSDNKYVQYRFLLSTFSAAQFTNTDFWQGVIDEVKLAGGDIPSNKAVLLNKWNNTTFGDAIIVNAYINSSNNWSLSDGAKVLLVPCKNSKLLYVKTNSSYSTNFAFLTEKHIESGLTAQFVDGTTTVRALNSSSEYTFDIPSDAKYIYIAYQLRDVEQERSKPESVQVDGVEYINQNPFGSLNNKVDINSANINELLPVNKRNKIRGSITSAKIWSLGTNSYSFLIEVTPDTKYQVQAATICNGVFLNNLPKSFYDGENLTSYVIGDRISYGSSSLVSVVPAGAKYLLLTLSINGTDYSPSKVIIDNVDYTKSIQGNLASLIKRPIITFTELEIQELYINKDYYSSELVSSIATAHFYRKFSAGGNEYYVGLLFRNASSQNVIDTRLVVSSDEADAILNSGIINLPNIKYTFKIKDNPTATTYQATAYLDNSIFDLYNSPCIYDYMESMLIENKEQSITIETAAAGKMINLNGELVDTVAPLNVSKAIPLSPGDVLNVLCVASNIASVIAEAKEIFSVNGNTTTYKKLVDGKSGLYNYTYKASDFCNIVITYNRNNVCDISIIHNEYKTFEVPLTFTQNRHIVGGGSIMISSNANFGASNPVKVYTGDKVKVSITGSQGITATLSLCDEHATIIDPVFIAGSASYSTYEYIVKSNGYIIISGNTQTNPAPKLTISRSNKVSDFEKMYLNQTKNEAYIREKRYYIDKYDAATPERYNSVFIYNGDTKVSNHHIVNAVAYPNGEIIACREGGDVVKIALDGTETVLLNIPGTWDWRGMFIDSNNNVYVSPHATTGTGTSLDVNNRGIWRLPYGGTQFTQVLKLYDPNSDVPTERQINDDTIWTFCEDAFGHIYAGVYAHTTRPNPSIYRSDDNGVTWTLASNLITDGWCNENTDYGHAMHIHCIIYNEFDGALYCIVGEVETVFKSTDFGETWEDLFIIVEDVKGTTLIAAPDGILIGSDGTKQGVITKMYSDNKSVKTVGRMWHAEFFGMRRSDVTGWLYAFSKIESGINNTNNYPPIAANTSQAALDSWLENATASAVTSWQMYHDWVAQHYSHDAIHPTRAAILVSKDEGETWEIIYAFDTNTNDGVGAGIYCVGYFKNGECLCGMAAEDAGGLHFVNPVIISEGKHKFTENGIDLEGEIFIKTNTSNYIV